MNIKRVLGGFVAGLVAVGTFTVRATTTNYWTGASGVDTKWSTAANWKDGIVPTEDDVVCFDKTFDCPNPCAVELDKDVKVKCLFIYSDTTFTGGNKLTVSGPTTLVWAGLLIRSNKLFVVGEGTAVDVTCTESNKAFGMNRNASIYALGGGSFKANYISFGDNSGQHIVASNANSKVVFTRLQLSGSTNDPNSDEKFLTYDGGVIEVNNTAKEVTYNPFSPVVDAQGGSIKIGNVYFNKGAPVVRCADGAVSISQFNQNVAGAEMTVKGTGTLTSNDKAVSMGGQAATLSLSGVSPQIVHTPNANFAIGAYATLSLAPEPTWSEDEGRIKLTGTGVIAMTGPKITVDCSAFKEWYGKKTIMLFQQKSTSAATYNRGKVSKTGEGEDKCTVSFEQVGQNLMMTIDSTNVAEGSVARVGHVGYQTLAEAFAAADGETVYLMADVTLAEAVTVDKAVTLDLGTFTVACEEGGYASASLFDIVNGGALTVTGTTGTVDGGANAAVCITGGAFCSPNNSTATFKSANDTVVFKNAGVMPTAEILGGNFASTDGKPVSSSAAQGFERLVGFLKGGFYNKEPEAALVAEGFVIEQVGDKWEVAMAGEPVCQIGKRTFASLERAYRTANDGDTITMITNEYTTAALTLDRDVSVIFELNESDIRPEEGTTLFTITAGTVDIRGKLLMGGIVLNGGTLKMNAIMETAGTGIAANGGTLKITGGDYVGDPAFAAGTGFKDTNSDIDNATFSSKIESKYLKGNRTMEQQGDRWVVVLASDEAVVTYTWNDEASGAWTNKANWTANIARPFGYPDSLNYATVVLPASMAAGDEITIDKSVSVKRVNWENTNAVKMVVDNAKLKISAGVYLPEYQPDVPFEPGKTGPAEITFRGERPQIEATAADNKGRVLFGENYETRLVFELPVTPWTKSAAPLYDSAANAPHMFCSNTCFKVDMRKLVVPEMGTAVTNFLSSSVKGVRYDNEAKTLKALEVVNCPAGVKYKLVSDRDVGLFFIATRASGLMFYVK